MKKSDPSSKNDKPAVNGYTRGFPISGLWTLLCKALHMRNTMPCVGLVVLAGCLTFVIAPDATLPGEKSPLALGSELLTVVIDPGHGGKDDGAKGNGLVEKDLTLDLALRVEKVLKLYGFPTVLTRRDNSTISLADRTAKANEFDHSIVLSLHFNHDNVTSSEGLETFYAKRKVPLENAWTWVGFFSKPELDTADTGEALAGAVQAAIVTHTEARNRGIKPSDLYMVRHTRAPSVLIEGGFLSNAFEARLLANPEYRDRLASAIAQGVMSYQKAQPRSRVSPPLAQLSR